MASDEKEKGAIEELRKRVKDGLNQSKNIVQCQMGGGVVALPAKYLSISYRVGITTVEVDIMGVLVDSCASACLVPSAYIDRNWKGFRYDNICYCGGVADKVVVAPIITLKLKLKGLSKSFLMPVGVVDAPDALLGTQFWNGCRVGVSCIGKNEFAAWYNEYDEELVKAGECDKILKEMKAEFAKTISNPEHKDFFATSPKGDLTLPEINSEIKRLEKQVQFDTTGKTSGQGLTVAMVSKWAGGLDTNKVYMVPSIMLEKHIKRRYTQ